MQRPLFYDGLPYRLTKDGDPQVRAIVDRHYSRLWRGKPGTPLFIGPGTKLVIVGVDGDWVFLWRRSRYRKDGQTGVECVVFNNQGPTLSSELILMSEAAWDRTWGPTRKFTFVNPKYVKSRVPGYCFLKAGWLRQPGLTSRGLILYTKEVSS